MNVELPQLGETVTEGTITKWFKSVGEAVAEDEILFEVSTDKVDSEVPSPAGGVLAEILVPEGETVGVGTALAVISDDGAAPASGAASESATEATEPAETPEPAAVPPTPAAVPPTPAAVPPASPPPVPAPAPASASAGVPGIVLSPIVRRLIAENDLNPEEIQGTGVGGRITRADVERRIHAQPPHGVTTPAAAPSVPSAPSATPSEVATPISADRDTTVPLSKIRQKTGEHMVRSKATSPHAMTAVEVDYEGVERARKVHKDRFNREEGFTLTYLPFIARAVIDAIDEFPVMNASVGDSELILHNYVNLSIAVDLDFDGLLAPVIRDAEQKRLRLVAREVHDLARRARAKQLSADEVTDGTFTITNAGSYGTFMVIPVINQPQVAILSTDGIRRKPVVVTDVEGSEAIAVHSVGVLAMSWDHRAFDGAYAAAFLARVREIIETRDWDAEL